MKIILLITSIAIALIGCGKDTEEKQGTTNSQDTTIYPPDIPNYPDTAVIGYYNICEKTVNHKILQTLTDIPAYIYNSCFANIGGIEQQELCFIYIDSIHPELKYQWLFPCENIPEQYKQYGLSVKISGNVIDSALFFCPDSSARMPAIYVIRNLSIQLNN